MDWKDVRARFKRNKEKYAFYEAKYSYTEPNRGGISKYIPKPHLSWAARAVDIRANKTTFDRFENDLLGLNEIVKKYKIKEALEQLESDILVCGIGFLAFDGKQVMPFTAEEATGVFDWHQKNLKSGVAVFRENTSESNRERVPDSYIEYYQDRTIIKNGEDLQGYINITGRPLIGMFTYKQTTKKPFGQSLITRAARDAIVNASCTTRQAMVAAYNYNIKVDVILGADTKTDVDKVEGQVGDILKIGPNDNGQIPQIGQFAQHAMQPFNDTILISARNFCADTKLSLANLTFNENVPQSKDALEIINDDLKGDIKKWQDTLGEQLKYFVTTMWMYDQEVRKLDDNSLEQIANAQPVWKPIFEADVSKFGDGLTKIAQQAPEIIRARSIWRNLGLTSEEIDAVIGLSQ